MPQDSTSEDILLVMGDSQLRTALEAVLQQNGYPARTVSAVGRVTQPGDEPCPCLVITKLTGGSEEGEANLREIVGRFPAVPVLVIGDDPTAEQAVSAFHAGAADYLGEPVPTARLLESVRRSLDSDCPATPRVERHPSRGIGGLVGASRPMLRLFERISRVAHSPAPVLIRGETGTGKELVARAVHHESGRSAFVPVNCGAIPEHLMESELFGHVRGAFTGADREREGLLQVADGGTLFLDEIGELPRPLQPKLLRAIEQGEVRKVGAIAPEQVDVRIVAATHRDLEAAVQDQTFRDDLFWRINVLSLDVPPLRERPTDIPLLVEHFCAAAPLRHGEEERCVSPNALAALVEYPWPGNVRQLRSVIERALTFTDAPEIDLDDLPEEVRSTSTRKARVQDAADRRLSLADLEREYIDEVLERTGGNKKRASEWLGLPRRTLYRRLESRGR